MSLEQEFKSKGEVILKPQTPIKPSEVLEQAQGKFIKCCGAMAKKDDKGKWRFCALGVLAFEKGYRPDTNYPHDSIKLKGQFDKEWKNTYYAMIKDNKEIGMESVLELYDDGKMNFHSWDVYTINDAMSFADDNYQGVIDFLKSQGY